MPGSTGTNLLTTIGQIRSLRPEVAARQLPVRTRCVVTYYDMEWGILFVQGPSGGIYVNVGAPRLDLHLGDWIELEGATAPGEYAPVITQPRFQLLGRAPLPEARRYSLKELSSGSQDSQWLSMAGIVHSVKTDGSHVTLDVAESSGHFEVVIPNLWNQPAPTNLVDAAIRLEGVCGTVFNPKRQLIGIRMCVPSMDFIKTEQSAPADPFSLPLRTVESLLQFTTDEQPDHRVLIRGAVTLHRPGEFTYVQDDTGGIRLYGETTGPLNPGDQIEVVGFPAPGTCGPMLIQAIWRKIGAGREPRAGRATAEQILSAEPNNEVFDSHLVSLRGRLLDLTTRSKEKMLVVQDGPFVFHAYLESASPLPVAPRLGSLVELTGVCAVQMDASHSPKSFQLYLRSPADLRIILSAAWWTARHTLGIIGVMGLIILAVVAWVMALRRRVQTQTRLIKQALAQEQALEARYRELFENNPHPMWVYDEQTLAFLAVNEAAVEHYGYSREEFLRMTIKDIRPPAEVDSLVKHLESGLSPHIQHGGHWKHRKKSGEIIDVEISSHQLVFTGRSARLVLVTDITERLRSEAELYRAQKELVEVSRQAGMAEVATSVLHNVGNVLNSANVSATVLADQLRKSKAGSLGRAVAMLNEHASDLPAFLTTDPKGKQLPGYFSQLAEILAREQQAALAEIESLRGNLEHIKDIVAMQQSYARVAGVAEVVKITDVVEDALRLNAGSLARHGVQVIRQFQDLPPMSLERHKILQILVNLVRNAKHACDESGQADKRMTLSVANGGTQVKISVSDNGVGIPPENLTRIFSYGFTTRKNGHGFGLHSGALAAKEMGGELTVHSDGPGRGATFTLVLPAPSNN